MSTLLQCIDEFIQNISVTDKQEDNIEASFNNLKKHLQDDNSPLAVKEVFLNGSYARDTIIRPLEDVDTFAVIDKEDYIENGVDPKPQTVLNKFKKHLEGCTEYNDKVRQDRPCVTIDLSYIHIDVLPAMRKSSDLYIPNETLTDWMLTDPKGHTDKLDKVNRLRNYRVKKIIQAVKSWKRENSIKIPSFHIEEIAIDIFNIYSFTNLEEGIRLWFDYAEAHLKSCRFGNNDAFIKVLNSINDAKTMLDNAKQLLDSDKEAEAEAKEKWASVFKKFPKLLAEEARTFSNALSSGTLKYGATSGLSTITGNIMGASKGFYGKND